MNTLTSPSAIGHHTRELSTRSRRPWLLPVAAAALIAIGAGAGVLIGRQSAAPSADSATPVATAAAPTTATGTTPSTASTANPQGGGVAAKPAPRQVAAGQQSSHPGPRNSAAERAPLDTRPVRAVEVCSTCGVIESVKVETRQGEGSGVGAVAGGVVGGLLGNQVGKGNGRTAMTVIGAIGGGMAGNEIEKRQRASTVYVVRVRMEDGTLRSFTRSEPWSVGQRVTVDGSALQAVSDAAPASSREPMLKTRG